MTKLNCYWVLVNFYGEYIQLPNNGVETIDLASKFYDEVEAKNIARNIVYGTPYEIAVLFYSAKEDSFKEVYRAKGGIQL